MKIQIENDFNKETMHLIKNDTSKSKADIKNKNLISSVKNKNKKL